MNDKSDGIRAGRLSPDEYARNFSDSHAPLNRVQALIEADRCYYCYDAPCIKACATGIDIPTFIQRIAQDNVRGAAKAMAIGVVLDLIVIPWPYVFEHYVKKGGDRWRRRSRSISPEGGTVDVLSK